MPRKTTKGRILKTTVFSFLFFAAAVFLLPEIATAQVDTGINQAAGIGLSDTDPRVIAARVIRVALGFLGIIALFLILYAGWLYMTSGGDPSKVDKAKKILSSAAIGLVIILSAFAIASFVLNSILGSTTGGSGSGGGGGVGFNGGVPASGNNIIEYHYPSRGQTGVPRNTSIAITFMEEIEPSNIINDNYLTGTYGDQDDLNGNGELDLSNNEYDSVNTDFVHIYKSVDGNSTSTRLEEVFAATTDNRTFVFKPVDNLGSPSENVRYTVALSSDLMKENGQEAFPGVFGGIGYYWSFQVSTIIDSTPPRITSIVPESANDLARNVVVQVNFNEPVNPLSASGDFSAASSFDSLEVNNMDTALEVAGSFLISNMYRTVEFLSNDSCGENSCGEDVYCLPATSTIEVWVKADDLEVTGSGAYPYDGVVDMADNSLDGNRNGTAEGPISNFDPNVGDTSFGDNFAWEFGTTDEIDLSAPYIEYINPGFNTIDIPTNQTVEARFNELMMSSSIKKNAVDFYTVQDVSYWLSKLDSSGPDQTTIEIRHDRLPEGATVTPMFKEELKDNYQNCFYPTSGMGCTATSTTPYCCDGVAGTIPCM